MGGGALVAEHEGGVHLAHQGFSDTVPGPTLQPQRQIFLTGQGHQGHQGVGIDQLQIAVFGGTHGTGLERECLDRDRDVMNEVDQHPNADLAQYHLFSSSAFTKPHFNA
nr:hypothetical protein [Rhodoferax sp. UBA5149]